MEWKDLEKGFAAQSRETEAEFEAWLGAGTAVVKAEPVSKEKPSKKRITCLLARFTAKQMGKLAFDTVLWAVIPGGFVVKLAGSVSISVLKDLLKKAVKKSGSRTDKKVYLVFESASEGAAVFTILKKQVPKLMLKYLKVSMGPQGQLVLTIASVAVGTVVSVLGNYQTIN